MALIEQKRKIIFYLQTVNAWTNAERFGYFCRCRLSALFGSEVGGILLHLSGEPFMRKNAIIY